MPTSPMMYPNLSVPAVISPFPQMLSGLIAVINKLIDHGYPKAAADIVNPATQGSLLFSKFEFSIKPDLRGLSFS